jgi:enoyl-CoA hydratase/carnithine racemase
VSDAEPVAVRRDGAIGHILLDRPDALNAVTVELGRQLHGALRELGSDPGVRVIVLRGAGGNFCAGGDFREVERLRAGGPGALAPLFAEFGRACDAIAGLEVPVIAAVEGYAMAGGFELMLAADIALVCDDARIADNHSNFGQIPGGGSSQRLPRIAGRQRGLGLILTGDRLTGAEAARWGLAYQSFPAAQFGAAIARCAGSLAGKDRAAAAEIKRLVYRGLELPLSDGLALEQAAVVDFIAGDAGAAGVARFRMRGA